MPRIRAALLLALLGAARPGAAAEPETFAVDPAASRVRIHLGRAGLFGFLGHDHEIDAPVAEGRVEVVEGDPSRSSVRLRFEARSLAVVPGTEPGDDVPKVEERMRGPEVLDVARHPGIVFSSSSVTGERIGPARYRLRVRGTLELKGRSLTVEVPLEVRIDGESLDARGEIELRLRDLGVEPPSVAGVVNVANRFRISFEVSSRAAAAPGLAARPPAS
jgi:polyisoprenoid-binding protein YceI